MKKILSISLFFAIALASCSDDEVITPPPSLGSTITLQGGEGGASAANSVYLDFSTETQTSIERISWHLGFNCGSDFGVILNNTTGSRATEAENSISINTIMSDEQRAYYKDTVLALGMGMGSFDIVDTIGQDLSQTIIKEGKTYLYDAGDADIELFKVNVTMKDNNTYLLKYALWNSSDVKTLEIAKKPAYHFVGASLAHNRVLDIQPEKNNWDMVWSRNTYISAMMPGVPFVMADIVFLNKGVQAAEIMIDETVTYENYGSANIGSAAFSSNTDAIGANWRHGGGPTAAPSVKTDRFYVIRDNAGNTYKLRFISMNDADGGVRGYPEVEYAIIR